MSDQAPTKSSLQLVAWMAPIDPPPVNEDTKKYFVFARIVDQPDFLCVVDGTRGGAWNYCKQDNTVFANKGHCPICGRSVPVNLAPDETPFIRPVRASNGHL